MRCVEERERIDHLGVVMYASDSMRAFPADPGVTSGDLGVGRCDAHPIAAAFLSPVPSLRLALSSPGTSPAARPFPMVSSGVPASITASAPSASMMSGLGRLTFLRSPYPTPPTGVWFAGLDRTDLSSPLAPLSDSPTPPSFLEFRNERGETRVFSVRVDAGISMLVKPLMLVTSPLSTRTRAAVMDVGAPPEMRSGTCTARPLPDLRRASPSRELVSFAALLRLPGESEPRVSMARASARSQNLGVTFCELRWDEDFFVVFLAAASALEFGDRGGLEFWSTLLRFLPANA